MARVGRVLMGLPVICVIGVPSAALAQSADERESPVIASNFRLSSGVTYSSGEYGELEDTEVVAIPISLTYRDGPFKVRVSVPYVRVDGPGSLLSTPEGRDGGGGGLGDNSGSGSSNSGPGSSGSGSGGSNSGSGGSGSGGSGSGSSGSGSSGSGSGGSAVEVEDGQEIVDDDNVVGEDGFIGPDNSRKGIGDISIAVSYAIPLGSSTYLEPGVKVKLPTASRTKRLGTGEVDVTASASLIQDIGDVSVYVGGRRKFAGKPEGSTIRSTWGAGGGISGRVTDGIYLGADYDWQESAFAGRQASSEVTGWANFRLTERLGLLVYAGTGLNGNSADLFGGSTLTARF